MPEQWKQTIIIIIRVIEESVITIRVSHNIQSFFASAAKLMAHRCKKIERVPLSSGKINL